MSIHESGEDYLEAIYLMQQNNDLPIKAIKIAKHFNYARSSVTRATKKLEDEGYITFSKQGDILLTNEGVRVAKFTLEKHLLLTTFLETIGVNKDLAEHDACKIEHSISLETFEALKAFLDSLKK